jgi:hypothetical protein
MALTDGLIRHFKFDGNLNEGFHIISGEWDKNYLKFYLNGECIAYSKLKMDEPKHLVVNLAVPSNDGSFKPGPDKNSIESIIFEVDYIRIWSGEKSNSTNSKTNFTSTTSEIQKTRLISKSSMHYGKKADHENEGIIISLFPITENEFELRVLGKKLPSDAKFKIVENSIGTFNVKKKVLYFFWEYVCRPDAPKVVWSSKTKRGAQAFINVLNRKR